MVIWTKPALADLKEIHDYIARNSRFYADNVVSAILKKVDKLVTFPEVGRFIPEKQSAVYREIIIYSYRIVYRVNNDFIYIIAIIHSRQDFGPTLEEKIDNNTETNH